MVENVGDVTESEKKMEKRNKMNIEYMKEEKIEKERVIGLSASTQEHKYAPISVSKIDKKWVWQREARNVISSGKITIFHNTRKKMREGSQNDRFRNEKF